MVSESAAPQKQELIERVLKLAEGIYRALQPVIPPEWLSSDLTVAQLRLLLLLYTEGALSMGALAARLEVAMSTATGLGDKLVAKGLVLRAPSAQDRRVVVLRLSPAGQQLMGRLWEMGRGGIARLLAGLTEAQLAQVVALVQLLYHNLPNRDGAGAA